MEIKDFLNLLSLGGVVTVLGLTEFAHFIIKRKAEAAMTDQELAAKKHVKMPWWFIVVPATGGFIFAVLEFFVLTPLEELRALSPWLKLAHAALKGLLGFTAAVVVFEARKQIWRFVRERYLPSKGGTTPPSQGGD